MTTTAVAQSTDFLILVDDLKGGTRAYRVDHFEVDIKRAVLRPVFDGGKTPLDFSSFASFRLVHPNTYPEYLYNSALRLLNN